MTATIHIANSDMPETIEGTDGRTYYRLGSRFEGTTLRGCRFGEGHTSHEYWAFAEGFAEDTFRLHAISATQFWLD